VLGCSSCLGVLVLLARHSSVIQENPSPQLGAWAGTVVSTGPQGVGVRCAQDKWEKAQRLLSELSEELDQSAELDFKSLEQKRGFFVHVQCTYPCITPYLKGFHNTLDSWRPQRDDEGWRLHSEPLHLTWDPDAESWEFIRPPSPSSPPTKVKAAPRLASNLKCLQQLFADTAPPLRLVRASSVTVVTYGFVDASGSGFGGSILLPNGDTIFRHGFWGSDEEERSSNYRELRNLVDTLHEGIVQGDLQGTKVFLFTDNSVAEAAYYKGNADNRHLFDLILRLRQFEMSGQLRLHVVHVSGTRMVAQGTDGLSRLDYTSGVMSGANMLDYIPLHLSALDQSPSILRWLPSWLPEPILSLTPEQWYTLGQGVDGSSKGDNGMWYPSATVHSWFLWAPPPAAAATALQQLSLSRHKRGHLNHIFIAPWLMMALWRKRLFKLADIMLELPAGHFDFWPSACHEPLILGLTLHFFSHSPWILRNTPKILAMGRQVRRLWSASEEHVGLVLRKLCQLPAVLDGMPPGMVWEVLHSPPE